MGTISFNPSLTTSPQDSFSVETEGYIQGFVLSDPNVHQWLESGSLASTVTQPVWGGMAITELVPVVGQSGAGASIALATTEANISGFTVFNRVNSMILVPGSAQVPLATSGMSVGYYKFGRNARLIVKCTAALVTALEGNASNTQVQWDFVNQQLIPFVSGTALNVRTVRVSNNGVIVNYNSTTGAATFAGSQPVAVIEL